MRKQYRRLTGGIIGFSTLLLLGGCTIDSNPQKSFGVFDGKSTAAPISKNKSNSLAHLGLKSINSFNVPRNIPASMTHGKPGVRHKLTTPSEEESVTLNDLTREGDCGGTVKFVFDEGQANHLEFLYNDYCEYYNSEQTEKQITNGSMKMITEDDDSYFFAVDLTVKSPEEDSKRVGEVRMRQTSDTDFSLEMTMEESDSKTGESSRFENVVIKRDEQSYTLSGRFYDDDGFYEVAMPVAMKFADNGVPYEGKMIVTGANNSSATIEVNGANYTVSIDEDGDGKADSSESGLSTELADSDFGAPQQEQHDTSDDNDASDNEEANQVVIDNQETANDTESQVADETAEQSLNKPMSGVQDDSI